VETKLDETVVVIYFDDIDETQICPELKAYRTHEVAKQKPAPVVIYDYYDNCKSEPNEGFYNVNFMSQPFSSSCNFILQSTGNFIM